MRLIKIIAIYTPTTELPGKTIWVGSKEAGVEARKQLIAEGYRRKDLEEVPTEVPTDKLGLLAFLNGGELAE